MAQMLKVTFTGGDAKFRCAHFFNTVEKGLEWEALRKPTTVFAEQYGRFVFPGPSGIKKFIPWVTDAKKSAFSETVEIKMIFSNEFSDKLSLIQPYAVSCSASCKTEPVAESASFTVDLNFQLPR